MTGERKIRANRTNAQASTGPKTARGRSHAARNALRHALSLPSIPIQFCLKRRKRSRGKLSGPTPARKYRNLPAASPKRRSTYIACVMPGIKSFPSVERS